MISANAVVKRLRTGRFCSRACSVLGAKPSVSKVGAARLLHINACPGHPSEVGALSEWGYRVVSPLQGTRYTSTEPLPLSFNYTAQDSSVSRATVSTLGDIFGTDVDNPDDIMSPQSEWDYPNEEEMPTHSELALDHPFLPESEAANPDFGALETSAKDGYEADFDDEGYEVDY